MTLAALILAASTLVTPPAPGGAADGEMSTNAVLSLRPDGNVFRLTFAVEATPSNNVEIALGADGNSDGDLSTAETAFLIGWRGDRWVAFDTTGEQVAEAISPGGTAELRWTVRLREEAAALRSLAATLDGSQVFSEWADNPPRCLFDPGWTLAKVFVRGKGPIAGRIALRRFNQGTVLVVR